MTNMKDLLDADTLSALKALKALATETPTVYTVDDEEHPTTEINGVVVDLRGDALHDTECADCKAPVQVEIAPKGVDLDLLTSKPRVAVCEPCGKARAAGKRGILVHHKPQVAKHQPRTKDGIDQPVEVKHIIEKEHDMDLSKYSAPQLAKLIEQATEIMRAKRAEDLAPSVKAAVAERVEDAKVDQQRLEEDRASRSGLVLPGLEVKGVVIPPLDMSEITDLGLVMSAKQRSPYNKALYRTGQPLIEADKATYGDIAKVHESLLEASEPVEVKVEETKAEPAPKAKKAKKAKAPKVTKVTAVVEPETKAKFTDTQVAAFAQVKGISKKKARALLDAI